MTYTAYGLHNNDDLFELKSKDGVTLNFLVEDCQGNIRIRQEFANCDMCSESLRGETAYIHAEKQYCKKCELKRRLEIRRNKKKNQPKAVKK